MITCCTVWLLQLCLGEAMEAATLAESPVERSASTEVTSQSSFGLDVTSYLVRSLYRDEDKDAVDLQSWKKGWGLSVYWNPDLSVLSVGKYSHKLKRYGYNVTGMGLALNKDLNKFGGIRLGLNYAKIDLEHSDNAMERGMLSLDYMWNLSNTYYGYDLSRKQEWLLTLGGKYGWNFNHSNKSMGGASLGIQYRKNVSDNMSFFLEQQYLIMSDDYDDSGSFHEVDPMLNLLVGLYFRTGHPHFDIVDTKSLNFHFLASTFFQSYAGLSANQWKADDFTFDGMSHLDRENLNFGINVGSWFNPFMGMRLGYFEQATGIGKTSTQSYRYQTLRGGRAELLLNPFVVLADRPFLGRIGWELSGGIESGQMRKHRQTYNNQSTHNTFTTPYIGLTFGTQIKYFLSDHYAVFLDGRFTRPSYSVSNADASLFSDGAGQKKERVYSAAAGIEYYISTFKRYERWSKGDNHTVHTIHRPDNHYRWWLEGTVGVGHPVHWAEGFRQRLLLSGGLGVGLHINDYHAFRLHADVLHQYHTFKYEKENSLIGGLDYMLNLTRLWWGKDEAGSRWSDLYLFAGPTLQLAPHAITESASTFFNAYGAEFGAQFTRRLHPAVDFFVEPRYQLSSQYPERWELLAGVKWHRWTEKNASYTNRMQSSEPNWFLEWAAGYGFDVKTHSSYSHLNNNGDLAGKLALGYRFNTVSSVRINNLAWRYGVSSASGNRNGKWGLETGLDYMLNLTNLWCGFNPYRKVNVRPFVGPVIEYDNLLTARKGHDTHMDLGLEAGLQVSYALTDYIDLLLEPRVAMYMWPRSYRNERLDFFAGVIFNNQRGWVHQKGIQPLSLHKNKTWFFELTAGVSEPLSNRMGRITFDPDFRAAVGLSLNQYHALRLKGGVTVAKVDNHYLYQKDQNPNMPEISFDYMYSLSNAMLGMNPYRRFDFQLFAGPALLMSGILEGDFESNYGLNAGAQLAWHMNNQFDWFLEPRYTHFYRTGEDYVSRMELATGIRFTLTEGFTRLLSSKRLKNTGSITPNDKLYTQLLLGGQLFTVANTNNLLKGYASLPAIDTRVGYKLNRQLNVQAGFYTNTHQMDNKHNVEAFGVRVEGVYNVLHLFNPLYNVAEERFNWNISAGAQLSRTRDTKVHTNDCNVGLTAATQLQYRVANHTWALFELRSQTLSHQGNIDIPITAQLGIQYDFSADKRPKTYADYSNWYVQAGLGMYDGRGIAEEVAVGYHITPVQSIRVVGAGANALAAPASKAGKWLSISPAYVVNLTQAILGNDAKNRRVDVSALAGFDYVMRGAYVAFQEGKITHKDGLLHSSSHVGAHWGAQISYRLNQSLSLYTESRFTWLDNRTDLVQYKHDNLNLFTMFGIKYRIPHIR